MIAVYVYYGNTRLGDSDSKPEYNNISWFTMLFACGVGVGECMIEFKTRYQKISSVDTALLGDCKQTK